MAEKIESVSQALGIIKDLQKICRNQRERITALEKENIALKSAAGHSPRQAENIAKIFGKAFGDKK